MCIETNLTIVVDRRYLFQPHRPTMPDTMLSTLPGIARLRARATYMVPDYGGSTRVQADIGYGVAHYREQAQEQAPDELSDCAVVLYDARRCVTVCYRFIAELSATCDQAVLASLRYGLQGLVIEPPYPLNSAALSALEDAAAEARVMIATAVRNWARDDRIADCFQFAAVTALQPQVVARSRSIDLRGV